MSSYQDLITRTFRDSAIRSVMMIDDDFLPYDQLVRRSAEPAGMSARQRAGSLKAANIHKFFQKLKVACDVDDGAIDLDADRIRKCDLIILDYHLEHEDPSRSLGLIHQLRSNSHMNLVVVYTSEDLTATWRQVAACLRGSVDESTLLNSPELIERWDELTEGGAGVPQEVLDEVTDDDLDSYALTKELPKSSRKAFGKNYGPLGTAICEAVYEHKLRGRNVITTVRSNARLVGARNDVFWLQSGNVFVAFHPKTNDQDDAPLIWDTLKNALARWNPSYYQLMISEIQNWLENEPLPFHPEALDDPEGQAALLSSMLSETCDIKKEVLLNQLLERLSEELNLRLLACPSIKDFANETFASLAPSTEREKAIALDLYSAEHLGLTASEETLPQLQQRMFHSLNAVLCARGFVGDFITNGTVLRDEDGKNFYLCVSPACDTVPEQYTSDLSARLAPHRMVKLITLRKNNLSDALLGATSGRNIFISVGRERIALSVQNDKSHNPTLEYVIVHDHTKRKKDIYTTGVEVSFFHKAGTGGFESTPTKLIPVVQLRDSYTARYQTVASHHTGRVGVDFVNFGKRDELCEQCGSATLVVPGTPPA